jgi:hypothetical protein
MRGMGIPDCIRQARETAGQIQQQVKKQAT